MKMKKYIKKCFKFIVFNSQTILFMILPFLSISFFDKIKTSFNVMTEFEWMLLMVIFVIVVYLLVVSLYILLGLSIKNLKPKMPKPKKEFIHQREDYAYIKDEDLPDVVIYLKEVKKYFKENG